MIDTQIEKQLDDDMQRGYSYKMMSDSVSACYKWDKAWKAIVTIMDSGKYDNIYALDKDFNGTQCIYNWASDYEMELGNASYKDISFAKTRIDFCRQYLNYAPDKNEINCLNMRRAIAESFYRMGIVDDGEREFKSLTEENPTWGWGWIGWADEYGIYSRAETKDYSKAIEILTNALKVSGIDEEGEIKTRLKEIYEECGMTEEANSIIIEKKTYGKLLSNVGSTLNSSKPVINEVRKVTKIGRNEPCPCGSGKKYKKCCGNK